MMSRSLPTNDLYDVISRRRDVRAEFTGAPLADGVLNRLLGAAHAAPSVGLSQPWDFIIVRDGDTRQAFQEHVETERQAYGRTLDGERRRLYDGIKIEGIRESTLGIVVTYHPGRGGPGVLGRNTIDDAGLYSVVAAIQNLWLAATAEGLGVGWVSFYREAFLQQLLDIPDGVRPVAWLCVGPVSVLHETPDLERRGWTHRRPLELAVHQERWAGDR